MDIPRKVTVNDDGRVDITFRKPWLQTVLDVRQPSPCAAPCIQDIPHLNLVLQVVGSRGDVQPFIALGLQLQKCGHRVRLATHGAFREPILSEGLEFFDIGGDPAELMAFMVKNPSLLPGLNTIRSGAIRKRRRDMNNIFSGCWRSCFETGDGTGLHHVPDDPWSPMPDGQHRPFVADAIIANPPSFAHLSCAERLGIPLNVMFTMPWSATQSFPHPLANLQSSSSTKPSAANFASYAIVEILIWEGLGDLINRFRKRQLGLDPLDALRAPSIAPRLRIPYTYLWSPSLLPKPPDWADHLDVCGFSILPLASDYEPPDDLAAFLRAGPPPVYIGFGSIVVDHPSRLTRIVFDAIRQTGQRALVSQGWGNLGADISPDDDNILLLDKVPHDWLFRHVSCVVHHGGAGTTAAGLLLGRPTVIVPFFGDQPFWGSIVARAGAGPAPVPYKQLTAKKLADAIRDALRDETRQKAESLGQSMRQEDGVRDAVKSFHSHLDISRLRCAVCPERPAVWRIRRSKIRLSAFAASVYRPKEYDTNRNPVGPFTAGAEILYGVVTDFLSGIAGLPNDIGDMVTRHHNHSHLDLPSCKNVSERQAARSSESTTAYDTAESSPDVTTSTGINTEDKEEDSSGTAMERESTTTQNEKTSMQHILFETRYHTGYAVKYLLNVGIRIPHDVTLSLSKGFHNAPKLYHDQTVQEIPSVLGMRSGLRAAGKEFTSGFYHGITGLITHPAQGLQRGLGGFVKGVGKGMGGVILKPAAGIWGLAGYPLDGLHKSLRRSLSRTKTKDILRSRIEQGHQEMCLASTEERANVIRRWEELV
ncbi:hypothetical protein EYZ11_000378 [Aspergillus tanneri]|uniref:Uncharacterized protein n=1 Tax=Aspergillus tanneri TaxID=1220188 RepID=A0A4S3JXD2_9EURO|nr:hypothetical protein EYZ11_000378 [Aspergillus tanneri]